MVDIVRKKVVSKNIPEIVEQTTIKKEVQENANITKPTESIAEKAFYWLLFLRKLDELMYALQRQGAIGFYGGCTGQEATLVGCGLNIQQNDWVVPALREGSILLMRGFDLEKYIGQYFGNEYDIQKGHQMPAHHSSRKYNHVSWSSCIGNQLPQATGLAYSLKYKKDDSIVFAFMGDGATSSADFHCALNFAGVWQVPVLFICQNNQWAITVPFSQQTATQTVAEKGIAYGIEGERIDGMDFDVVYDKVKEKIKFVRENKKPFLLETLCYRIGPHSTSDDPTKYRNSEEVELWKQKDPIKIFKEKHSNVLNIKELEEQYLQEIHNTIRSTINKVKNGKIVDSHTLIENVFENIPERLNRQFTELE